jgi:methionyl-tRNA formyltransferase
MKILIFANSSLFVKTVTGILDHIQVVGIIIPDTSNNDLLSTVEYAEAQQIPLLKVSAADLKKGREVNSWILATGCNAALVMTFPFKIPESILNIPEKGVFNVHYSMLPAYKGPDPVFWQLKNGLKEIGLSIHKVTDILDEGPLVFRKAMVLMPGENYGLAAVRLTLLLSQSLDEIFQNILAEKYFAAESEIQTSYFKRPQVDDLTINWEQQSAVEIENLVNAANPRYNGAISYLNEQPVRILEVSGVDGKFEPGTVVPGTVFHIDPHHGPMVLTVDKQLLLFNIVETENGIFSGKKWCAMGLKQGDKFVSLN